jgi:broad specificity phosphatase PhoE
MKIIFVRHGESKHNAKLSEEENSGLTIRGKRQAELLGKKLKNHGISAIYTSSLLRAKETGGIISKITGVPVKGRFEELDEYGSQIFRSGISRVFNFRLKKLKKLLSRISKDRKKEKTILLVAHGGTNRIIMAYFLQMPMNKHLLRFTQHNTAINSIDWLEKYRNWRMERMNDISHLPERMIVR